MNDLEITCQCSHILKMKPKDFFHNYVTKVEEFSNEKNKNVDYYCKCKDHLMKVESYCIDCEYDICNKCIEKDKRHFNHTQIIFSNEYHEKKTTIINCKIYSYLF